MSVALKVLTSMRACSGDVCHETRLAARVSEDTPGFRSRADVDRAQDLDCAVSKQRVCVTDTHGLRGGADVNRAQDLDGAVCTQCMCVRRYTWFEG